MIKYTLQCAEGHAFEEWFNSMAHYDERAEAKNLTCPDCGSTKVGKAIMAPNVAGGARSSFGGGEPAPGPSCGCPSGLCGLN